MDDGLMNSAVPSMCDKRFTIGKTDNRRCGQLLLSARTAEAVAASLMKGPASEAGSRFLFMEVANQAPLGSWCCSSHAIPLAAALAPEASPEFFRATTIRPVP